MQGVIGRPLHPPQIADGQLPRSVACQLKLFNAQQLVADDDAPCGAVHGVIIFPAIELALDECRAIHPNARLSRQRR